MSCSAGNGMRQLLLLPNKTQTRARPRPQPQLLNSNSGVGVSCSPTIWNWIAIPSCCRKSFLPVLVKASPLPEPDTVLDGDGVSLGTMKLPLHTDLPRFETLLFQWANSLCQGANVPLPLPLKIDKIEGGVRLGFVVIQDTQTEVPVYIDCLVFPGSGSGDSGPIFRAIRNGAKKDKPPPGEPRIMKSLLAALTKSVQIAASPTPPTL